MGGENRALFQAGYGPLGSSPRGRGKPVSSGGARVGSRLIPAWAGKTGVMVCPGRVWPAHPRVGGENAKRAPKA